jgi:hypothetical protein
MKTTVANLGCLSRIRIFPSRIKKIPDIGSGFTSKNLSTVFLTPKIVSTLSDLENYPSRGQKGTGSRIRIHNTDENVTDLSLLDP